MAPHSSTLAWKILWTEEPGRLQSMGSLRVRYDWGTWLYFSLSCIGEGNGNPLQCSCLENPRDGQPGGLLFTGSHRVGHDWSDSAAAEAAIHGFATLFSPSPKHSRVLDLPLTGQIKDQTIHVSTVITILYLVLFRFPYHTSLLFTSLK